MNKGYMTAVERANATKAGRNALPTRADPYARAWQRVQSSPRMRGYADILLAEGWASDEDHLRWVISGKMSEIVAWAEQIRGDSAQDS
jgi:hypothetical protein